MDSVPNSQVKADAQDSIIPNLKSALGMDYTQLRNLVAISEWKKADEETARVMLTLRGREKEGWPDKRSIDYFPCEDLRIIDRLWVNYSDGRFGFSVQKGIYQSLGGTEKYDEKILQAFGDRVGWRKEENWLYYSSPSVTSGFIYRHIRPLCSTNRQGYILSRWCLSSLILISPHPLNPSP
jgi:hypothetical protein